MNNIFNTLRKYLAPPVFEDEDKTRVAFYLNWVSVSVIGMLALYLLISNLSAQDFNLSTLDFILLGLIGLLLAARYAMIKGYVKLASQFVVGFIWLGMAFQAQSSDGIRDVTFFAFFVVILMASLLLGTREMLVYTTISVLTGFWLVYLQNNGTIDVKLDTPQNFARDITFIFALFAIFLYLVTSSLRNALQSARTTAQDLEVRVSERTKALETSAEVSRSLASILDTSQLAGAVVNQVQTAFNYYYAQIYLFDEIGENLALTAGTGEAGAEMMKRGHSLQKGRGLVGRAAGNNESVLVSDTSQDPEWLPNELLPDTKAEAAIPIAIGDQVLGVLDVQDNITNDITPDDITLLESLAGQVAISLQNARLYAQAESAAQEAKSLVEYAAEGILVLDLTNGLFSEPNENASKIYGLSREELVKVGPAQVSPPNQPDGRDSTEKAMEMIGVAMEKGTNIFEWNHINRQGDEFPCEIRLVRLPGDQPRLRVTVTDITERQALQKLTAQQARQQEAINTITQRIQSATTIEEAMQVAARELGHALGQKQTVVALEPSALGGNGQTSANK